MNLLNNLLYYRPRAMLRRSLNELQRVARLIEKNNSAMQSQFAEDASSGLYGNNDEAEEKEWDFYHQSMVRMTNNAFFCQMFVEFEIYMVQLMDARFMIKNNKNYNEPRDNGSTYSKYLKFIKDELKIQGYDSRDEWVKIEDFKNLRNRMVHSAASYSSISNPPVNGKNKDRSRKLKDLVDKDARFGIESFLLPISEDMGIREVEHGCFYVKDISLLSDITDLMLTEADHIFEHLQGNISEKRQNS